MEVDLDFLGLVILHNTLKPQTIPIIKQLQKANIKCIMATGKQKTRLGFEIL